MVVFQLEIDAKQFQAIANKAWDELTIARNHYPGDRIRRQAYGGGADSYSRGGGGYTAPTANVNKYAKKDSFVTSGPSCNCNSRNSCPAGPPGVPGKPVSFPGT